MIEVQRAVSWGELDALGHVNNTVFFRWFEDSRIAMFDAVGIETDKGGIGPILATTTCDFIEPVTFPATVTARATIGRIGNTSFVMHYEVRTDRTVARGTGVIVMVDYRKSEKVPLSDDLRGRLIAHQQPEAPPTA